MILFGNQRQGLMSKPLKYGLWLGLLLSFSTLIQAQVLRHVPGEILIQFRLNTSPDRFLENFIQNYPQRDIKLDIQNRLQGPILVWRLHFNPALIHEGQLLATLRKQDAVEAAQFNHFINNRTLPDDPFFSFQWHLRNTGFGGGTAGVDLQADPAWDLSTGGTTLFGDTIVLAVIDDGFDAGHEDLAPNSWINHQEIPDNEIDDDGNGYIDDYQGWNVNTVNDDIVGSGQNNWHGTPVAGIAGACGNNSIGITGVNWYVKMMYVVRGPTEADVIEAYTYPYKMRQLYNQTNGEQGAFVVATNSSWGINYGQTSDAPLWCAFYDSLGQEGILNAASTINADVDVDIVGDLPTACPSEYLIAVTSLDRYDKKAANAGFGPTHIDLGAFGEEIFTTLDGNRYRNFSGTSAAAPQVAGAIALMYAANCPSLLAFAKADPAQAALQIRQYLLDYGHPNSSLANITLSGKRLNLFNSLTAIQEDCDFSGCYNPANVQVIEATDEQVTINWNLSTTSSLVNLRYRPEGTNTWNNISEVSSPFVLNNLSSCSRFEFQIQAVCGTITNDFSLSHFFETKGCCQAPSTIDISFLDDVDIYLEWPNSFVAVYYPYRYKASDDPVWIEGITESASLTLEALRPCQKYQFQVQQLCTNGDLTPYSSIQFFTTRACNACLESTYCAASGPAQNSGTWVSRVKLGDLDHSSGSGTNGYSDFTEFGAPLIRGFAYELSLETDFEFLLTNPTFVVWIDLNQDGEFGQSAEQLFFDQPDSLSSSGTIVIPSETALGNTRLRISARDQAFPPCGTNGLSGEVEDYCMDIVDPITCLIPTIPVHQVEEQSAELTWNGNILASQYLIRYRAAGAVAWTYQSSYINFTRLSQLSPCTDYQYQIQAACDEELTEFCELQHFRTLGCGNCLDQPYCQSRGDASFEWIDQVSFNNANYYSGNNAGYLNSTETVQSLERERNYEIRISPNWANMPLEESYTLWVDLNQDGIFQDSTERLAETNMPTTADQIVLNYQLPGNTQLGSTKIRLMMKYLNEADAPCETDFFGEIEDYCINVVENEASLPCPLPSSFQLNISALSESTFLFSWNEAPASFTSFAFRYRALEPNANSWTYTYLPTSTLILTALPECTAFESQISIVCEGGIGQFSSSYFFETTCITPQEEVIRGHDEVRVFPNPFREDIYLEWLGENSPSDISLFDVQGRLVHRWKHNNYTSNDAVLSIPAKLSAGIYFLQITRDLQREILKLIKY